MKKTIDSDGENCDLPASTPAPNLPYRPQTPKRFQPKIGLIGCGGITEWHLKAYLAAGYQVTAMCDLELSQAEKQRDEFYPRALVTDSLDELLANDEVDVVDVATHPPVRPPLVEAALKAGKHVLSQKPFVEDLAVGQELVDLADNQGVLLAVNQNGRWAPHWAYLREAVSKGLLGELSAVHCNVHWDHGWVAGTEFENVRHLVLYDFAIHWFDLLTTLMGNREPKRVFASMSRTKTQQVRPALLGQAIVEYDDAQATLVFDGDTQQGAWETTVAIGDKGTVRCEGPDSKEQELALFTEAGVARPDLEGCWFPDGFRGTMGELLCAVEESRMPTNNAADNLASLALCFAAVASAERGEPVVPGSVTSLAEAMATAR